MDDIGDEFVKMRTKNTNIMASGVDFRPLSD